MTMKKILVLLIGLILVAGSLVVSGCQSSNKSTGEVKAEPKAETIELRFTTVNASTQPNFKVFEEFANKVNEKTNGRVKITVYPTGTLNPPPETFNAVKTGLADIGAAPVGYSAAIMPLSKLLGDAMMGVPNVREATRIWNTAYNEMPELQKEFEDMHVLWLYSTSPLSIGTTKKPIHKIEDFKGLVMRFPPGTEPLAKAWGVSPVNMPVGDIYSALQKGAVSGFMGGSEMLQSMKLAEFTKHVTQAQMVFGLSYAAMNKKVWDSLPADVQQILDDVAKWAHEAAISKNEEAETKVQEFAKSQGVEFITLDQAELQKLYSASKPVFDQIAAGLEEKGKPAKKILNELEKLSSQK